MPNWHKENIELQAGDKYFLVHKTLEKRQFLGENKILPEVLLQVGLELERVQPLAKIWGGTESVCLTYSLHVPYLSTLSKTFQPFAFFIILHYGWIACFEGFSKAKSPLTLKTLRVSIKVINYRNSRYKNNYIKDKTNI